MMRKIKIKPLSVNACWCGKRFKTKAYKEYEQEIWYQLPKIKVKDNVPIYLVIVAGINTLADIDNVAKPFLDILQKKYQFNDRWIHELHLIKEEVKKGNEFIKFSIEYYE